MNHGNRRTLSSNATQQSSSAGKNPYELRTELLELAYQICYNRHVSGEINSRMDEGGYNKTDPVIPRTTPDTEEVVECASSLNDFISQKHTGGNHGVY